MIRQRMGPALVGLAIFGVAGTLQPVSAVQEKGSVIAAPSILLAAAPAIGGENSLVMAGIEKSQLIDAFVFPVTTTASQTREGGIVASPVFDSSIFAPSLWRAGPAIGSSAVAQLTTSDQERAGVLCAQRGLSLGAMIQA